jgi:hypothetical protein
MRVALHDPGGGCKDRREECLGFLSVLCELCVQRRSFHRLYSNPDAANPRRSVSRSRFIAPSTCSRGSVM